MQLRAEPAEPAPNAAVPRRRSPIEPPSPSRVAGTPAAADRATDAPTAPPQARAPSCDERRRPRGVAAGAHVTGAPGRRADPPSMPCSTVRGGRRRQRRADAATSADAAASSPRPPRDAPSTWPPPMPRPTSSNAADRGSDRRAAADAATGSRGSRVRLRAAGRGRNRNRSGGQSADSGAARAAEPQGSNRAASTATTARTASRTRATASRAARTAAERQNGQNSQTRTTGQQHQADGDAQQPQPLPRPQARSRRPDRRLRARDQRRRRADPGRRHPRRARQLRVRAHLGLPARRQRRLRLARPGQEVQPAQGRRRRRRHPPAARGRAASGRQKYNAHRQGRLDQRPVRRGGRQPRRVRQAHPALPEGAPAPRDRPESCRPAHHRPRRPDRQGPARPDRRAAEGRQDARSCRPIANAITDQQPRGPPHGGARRRAPRRGHRHAAHGQGRGHRLDLRPSGRRPHHGRRARHRARQAPGRAGQRRRRAARLDHPPGPRVQPGRAGIRSHPLRRRGRRRRCTRRSASSVPPATSRTAAR